MYRIIFYLFANGATLAMAQTPAAHPPLNIQQLRQVVKNSPAEQQAAVLSQTMQHVIERIKTLKSQEPNNPELVDLIELRILVSPIAVLAKKGLPASDENCLQTQHEIQYMESFAEQEQRNSNDGKEALSLLKLFCAKLEKK